MAVCLAMTTSVFAQAKTISHDDFYEAYRAALDKEETVSWRKITKKQELKNGKAERTVEITEEFLKPDRRRYVNVQKTDKSSDKNELIQIGKVYYCRKNESEWTKSENWCSLSGLYATPADAISKYSVEAAKINNQQLKLYQNYTTWIDKSSDGKKAETHYWHEKIWFSKAGLIVRLEIETGLVEPQTVYLKWVDTYEYNPKNIKIEAPVLSKTTK